MRDHPGIRPDIQALRALAVTLVVVGHSWPGLMSGGYVGVDVFFAISGFLITSHLLAKATAHGQVSLLRFWGDRAIRILPPAILVLLLSAVCTLLIVPSTFWRQFLREILAAALYSENWLLAMDSADYWAANTLASPVRHYWSLSAEEQFYIFMPLVLVAALRTGRSWKRWYGLGLGVIALVSFAHSIQFTNDDPSGAYFVTTTRTWEFASGSLLALVIRPVKKVPAAVLATIGFSLVLGAAVYYDHHTSFPSYMAAVPVAGCLMVISANESSGILRRLYSIKPVQLIGDVSYAIYLWHWPLTIFSSYVWLEDIGFGGRLALVGVTISIAWLSTRFFEDPIRFTLSKPPQGRRTALVGIGIAMFTLLASTSAGWWIMNRLPRTPWTERVFDECFGAMAMVSPNCGPPTQMTPGLIEFTRDKSNRPECWAPSGVIVPVHCALASPASPSMRVAAIGDSHSNSLIPALDYVAKTFGWSIDVYGKDGCYLTTAKLHEGLRGREAQRRECIAWRQNLQKELSAKSPYDLILVTHWEGSFLPDSNEAREHEVQGLIEAWGEQIARGAKIIAITDTPKYATDVVACIAKRQLAGAVACGLQPSQALPKRDSNVRAAELLEGAVAIDTRRYYCTDDNCLAVIGSVPVLLDRHHITATFARSLGPLLADDVASAMKELGFKVPFESGAPQRER